MESFAQKIMTMVTEKADQKKIASELQIYFDTVIEQTIRALQQVPRVAPTTTKQNVKVETKGRTTGYLLFCKEHKEEFKAEAKEHGSTATVVASSKWKILNDVEKEEWNLRAADSNLSKGFVLSKKQQTAMSSRSSSAVSSRASSPLNSPRGKVPKIVFPANTDDDETDDIVIDDFENLSTEQLSQMLEKQ